MSEVGKTVRVFISSTFRDMHTERDYLSRFVFPELRSRCLKRGAAFIGLDLRWGVTEEEAQQEGALAICLKEIERCRPFFVCLLGSRFGWVPPPEEIGQHFFDQVAQSDSLPAEVSEWYKLDLSSVPMVYRLRRDDRLPTDVAERIASYWESKGLALAGESITSREILRAVFEDGYPPAHALFYQRRSGVERDSRFPQRLAPVFVEEEPSRRKKLAALKRKIRSKRGEVIVRGYDAWYAGLRIDRSLLPQPLAQPDQEALRDGLIEPSDWAALSEPVKHAVEQHGTVALTGMEALGQTVLNDLWAAIEKELERPSEQLDAHQQERAFHERFVKDRTRIFLGRSEIVDRILDYIKDDADRSLLVVTGEPGSGKSALLAKCVELWRTLSPEALVIPHFIGASPGSAQLPSTLWSLAETLRRECELEDEIPADPEKLKGQFRAFLEKAGAKREVVVALDAINQLDPAVRSHEFGWLPVFMPRGVRLIVSTLAGDCLDRLTHRVPADHIIDVPPLDRRDQETLVDRHLMLRRKRLSDEQRTLLLDEQKRPDTGLPLYLLVALEELTLFGNYEALSDRIENLPPRLPDLFQQVLSRLEQDHGQQMTESTCRWMAVSRSGLLESEILDLLSSDEEFPRATWTRFYRALEFYLRPTGEDDEASRSTALLDFYHDQLRFAVHRRYMRMELPASEPTNIYSASHRELSSYFRQIASDEGDPRRWHKNRPRGLSELPFHQTRGETWPDLEATLCDLGFIEAKCAAGMTYDLVMDYEAALAALPEAWEEQQRQCRLDERVAQYTREMIEYAKSWSEVRDQHERDPARIPLPRQEHIPLPESPPSVRVWTDEEIRADSARIARAPTQLDRVRAFGQFVGAESHVLARFGTMSGFCIQQAYNLGSSGPVATAAEERVAGWNGPLLFLRTEAFRPPSNLHPACLKTLVGHTGGIRSVALTVDGRRAISGSEDNMLRVWDLETGQCLKTLEGHKDSVEAVALTADGRRAISGSNDRTLRVWDLETGQCLKTLEGHKGWVQSVALTADGRRMVSGSGDHLRVWDLETSQCMRTLEGHRNGAESVALTADGRVAVSAGGNYDNRLCVWDLETSQCLKTLEGHTRSVQSVALTADGRQAVSGSDDRTLRVWDLESGRCLKILEGHRNGIQSVGLTADGQRAVSGSNDGTLRVWNLETGECLKTLEGHTNWVSSVALTVDGRRAVSGSGDYTLRSWDLETGQCLQTLEEHSYSVESVGLTLDGRHAVSGRGDHKPRVWDLETGKCLKTLEAHTSWVESVALTADGRRAVSGSDDRTLRVWDLETGQCLKILEGHTRDVGSVALTADGRRAVSGSDDSTLRVWDLETGQCLKTLKGHRDSVFSLVLTADGRRAVSGSRDNTARVWDLETGQCLQTLEVRVESVALTADGRAAVSVGGSFDNKLRVWDLATGQCLKTLKGHASGVHSVALTADGRRAVSGSDDNTLRVWDLATGQCLKTLEGHTRVVQSVALTADGRRAVSRSDDKTLRVWELETGQCLAVRAVDGLKTSSIGDIVVAGTARGFLEVFRPSSPLLTRPPWVTPVLVWRFGEGASRGHWDERLSTVCPRCGQRFAPHQDLIDAIQNITVNARIQPSQSTCLALPMEAWNDERLVSECPHCPQPLRFNPFIVDNRPKKISWSSRLFGRKTRPPRGR